MGTLELEIGEPYMAMLEEIREQDGEGVDEELASAVENILHNSMQQKRSTPTGE